MQQACKNCAAYFTGNFCNNCGQKKEVQRFTFKHITSEILHAFTHADKSFLHLFAKMFFTAGTVAYEYIVLGKRKKYFNLFTFFILVTTIAAFVEGKDLALKEKLFNQNNEYGYLFTIYLKLFILLQIPILAFLLWLFYHKKTKLLYSEYTILTMVLITVKLQIDIVIKALNYGCTLISKSFITLDENLLYPLLIVIVTTLNVYKFHKPFRLSFSIKTGLIGFALIGIYTLMYLFIIWSLLNNFKGLGITYIFGIRISG